MKKILIVMSLGLMGCGGAGGSAGTASTGKTATNAVGLDGTYHSYQYDCYNGVTTTVSSIVTTDHTHYFKLTFAGNLMTTLSWNSTCSANVKTVASSVVHDSSVMTVQDLDDYSYPVVADCPSSGVVSASNAASYVQSYAFEGTGLKISIPTPGMCGGTTVYHFARE